MSLHDLMKQNQYRGFWVQDIQSISMQCLQALNFMHTELSLTHTDLKIENVLFVSTEPPKEAQFLREASWQEGRQRIGMPPVSQQSQYLRPSCTKVKLIDFGNATYERETHPKVINTRQYRAPEVFLDLGWNERSDLWAVGCTIMELYTGSLLFRTQESLEHLALIEQTVAKFPESMLQKTKTQQERFVLEEEEDSSSSKDPFGLFSSSSSAHFRLRWPEGATSAASVNRVKQQRSLQKLTETKHRAVADFAASLLAVDPAQRPSAQRALEHPFFGMRFLD
jgi:dual-specificity kinase